MEDLDTSCSEQKPPTSSPQKTSLTWRIARYLLLVVISAAMSEFLHVEFIHKVSDKFTEYAREVQPLALVEDFLSVLTSGQEPVAKHSTFGNRTLAEQAQDLSDSSKVSPTSGHGTIGVLTQIPHATWYVLRKSFSQGWVSFVIIVLAIGLAYRAAIRNTDDGNLTRAYRIVIAPMVGLVMMGILMLVAVGIAALTTTVISFFSIIFSPAVLVGSLKEERIHRLTEQIAHRLPHNPTNPNA